MAELLPCPFCGCKMQLVEKGTNMYYEHPDNDCFLASADSEYGCVWFDATDNKSRADWNRRTPQKINHNSLCETDTYKG